MSKFLAWSLLLIVLVSGGVFLYKNNLSKNLDIVTTPDEQTLVDKFFISDDDREAWVTFVGQEAFLSLIDTEYENINLSKLESETEVRYQNVELGIILIETKDEIVVYKNEEIIFSGKDRDVVLYEKLINNTWVWNKTYKDSGSVSPKDIDAFTINFTNDGQINGTTDCNNFSGTYEMVDGEIYFGPITSTEKFCADSQESEFLSMLKEGAYTIGSQNFYIENEQTVMFNIKL